MSNQHVFDRVSSTSTTYRCATCGEEIQNTSGRDRVIYPAVYPNRSVHGALVLSFEDAARAQFSDIVRGMGYASMGAWWDAMATGLAELE